MNKSFIKWFAGILCVSLVTFMGLSYEENTRIAEEQRIAQEQRIIEEENNATQETHGYGNIVTLGGKRFKEYKQYGAPYSSNEYWDGTMKSAGCGLCVMATVLDGYGVKLTPEELRQKYYPKLNYKKLASEFRKNGVKATEFIESVSNSKILNHLDGGNPVIVCVWSGLGQNRWTNNSHYMILLDVDMENKRVFISNPGGYSEWADISELTPYVAKLMYIG